MYHFNPRLLLFNLRSVSFIIYQFINCFDYILSLCFNLLSLLPLLTINNNKSSNFRFLTFHFYFYINTVTPNPLSVFFIELTFYCFVIKLLLCAKKTYNEKVTFRAKKALVHFRFFLHT